MALSSSDLYIIRSTGNSDTAASNGGRMGTTAITSGAKNNVFPDVTQAERAAGLTRWRKLFVKAANSASDVLSGPLIHLSKTANGDDRVTLAAGDWRGFQSGLSSPREYGVGILAADADTGDSVLTVTLEDSALDIFADTDSIWIGAAGSVNGEYHHGVTVSKTLSTVTVTFASGDTLQADYAAGAYVASAYVVPTDIQASSETSKSSTSGTYDFESYPVELTALGAVEDTFTLTFVSPTAFTVSGLYAGTLASGSIAADYAPVNTATSLAYFTLRAAGFGGTWAAGDTITIITHPSAAPIWLKQVVPTGAAAVSADTFELAIKGESA